MRVLVTGAAGFIGSHVVRDLSQRGHDVVALTRGYSSPPQRLADLRGRVRIVSARPQPSGAMLAGLDGWQPEACIHLAWYVEPGKYLDAGPENVESLAMSLRLVEELSELGCGRVVMAGTCFEYDTDAAVLVEDGPTRPATVYAACKLACGIVGAVRARALGMSFAWARLFYLYGPHEDERRLVPKLVATLLEGKEFRATSGTQVRDYLHVADVARGLGGLAEAGASGIFNVCSAEPVTIAALIGEASKLCGRPDLVRFGALEPRAWEPPVILGDNGRLRAATAWAPAYSLTAGLTQTIAWWRSFRTAAPIAD